MFLLTNNKNCYYLTIAVWNKIQTIFLCLKVKFCVFSRTGVIKNYFILRLTFLISCTLSSGLFPLLDSDSDTDSCTMQDLFRFGLWSPDWNVCNRDGDLSLGQGSESEFKSVETCSASELEFKSVETCSA